MKFASTVVMLALICGTQSSVLPLNPWANAWGNPWGLPWGAPLSVLGGTSIVSAPPSLPSAISLSQGPALLGTTVVAGSPSLVAAAHGPAVVAAPALVAGGSYVAQTRGAVHVAPLPGHLNSAASINLQPAPGTW